MKSLVFPVAVAVAVAALVASSGVARAQQPTLAGPAPQGEANGIIAPQKSGTGTGTPAKSTGGGKDEGYGYEFSDDPLAAGGFGPNDATIRVRPGPVRTTLIRPRTSFVPEMLKSVENL